MVNQELKIVAFTGHRTYRGVADKRLRDIVVALYERGARIFRVGMAEGFDLHAGEIVAEMISSHPDIILEAYIPWPEFALRFSSEERERYNRLIAQANVIHYTSYSYSADIFHRRNDMLVEGCDTLVAWWKGQPSGTGYTVRRGRKLGCEVINLCDEELFSTIPQ